MPRSNLIRARKEKPLSQSELAARIETDRKCIARWEAGTHHPQPLFERKLIKELGDMDGHLLDLDPVEPDQVSPECHTEALAPVPEVSHRCPTDDTHRTTDALALAPQMPPPCHRDTPHDTIESSDGRPFIICIPRSVKGFREFMELFRRQFNAALATFLGAKLFDNVSLAIVSSPTVDPEDYLDIVEESIGTWWQWYYQGNYRKLERVLLKHAPILKRLATTLSPFQGNAASLAVQAKILQILLATRNLQFGERERYCIEAVRFGALSGDSNLHAIALEWHGNTYTLCHRRPQQAIAIFNEMLPNFNSDMSQITQSAIYSNLSIAHAQVGDETNARDYIEMAHATMPSHPELDFLHRYIQFNSSSLDHYEGKMYLHLAEHFPNGNYAQKAYYALVAYTEKQAIDRDSLSASLIKKADAARTLDHMNECVEDLTEGFHIGDELDCLRRLIEADDVMGRIPPEWKREKAIQNLQKEIAQAIKERSQTIIIARR